MKRTHDETIVIALSYPTRPIRVRQVVENDVGEAELAQHLHRQPTHIDVEERNHIGMTSSQLEQRMESYRFGAHQFGLALGARGNDLLLGIELGQFQTVGESSIVEY